MKSNGIVLPRTSNYSVARPERESQLRIAIDYYGKERTLDPLWLDVFHSPIEIATPPASKLYKPAAPQGQESIDACNKFNIAMVFTGLRH